MTGIGYVDDSGGPDPADLRRVLVLMARRAARLPDGRAVLTEIAGALGAIKVSGPDPACGTLRGARRHQGRLEPLCAACRRARRERWAQLRRERPEVNSG